MKVNMSKVALLTAALTTIAASGSPAWAGDFAQKHPRRAEVLGRGMNLNHRITKNAGNLDGHYNQLKHEDHSIHRQEQADARANGGHITAGEKQQLNREENHVSRQIQHDKHN
jgi:hypothetical protein